MRRRASLFFHRFKNFKLVARGWSDIGLKLTAELDPFAHFAGIIFALLQISDFPAADFRFLSYDLGILADEDRAFFNASADDMLVFHRAENFQDFDRRGCLIDENFRCSFLHNFREPLGNFINNIKCLYLDELAFGEPFCRCIHADVKAEDDGRISAGCELHIIFSD